MDVSVSVSFFQDELASTIEHAVKAAVDTVLCQITKVVGGKFTEFQMEMAGKEKENESLKLRLEISESELKAMRLCVSAADANIKQALGNMNTDCNEQDHPRIESQRLFNRVKDSRERRSLLESESGLEEGCVYTPQEGLHQDWGVSQMRAADLTSVESEAVKEENPELDFIVIKEETPEVEYISITGEVSTERDFHELQESSLCEDPELICMKPNQPVSEDTGSSVGEEGTVLGSIQRKHHPPQERAADGKEEGAMPSTSSTASDVPEIDSVTSSCGRQLHRSSVQRRPVYLPSWITDSEDPRLNRPETQSAVSGPGVRQPDPVQASQRNRQAEPPFAFGEFEQSFQRFDPQHAPRDGPWGWGDPSPSGNGRNQPAGSSPSYHCPECAKSFTNLRNLKTHRLIHSGEKPYQCGQCGKSFRQMGAVRKHQRIHTGEKPYQCTECGKSFNELGNLRKHQRIHAGVKPYHCTVCGRRFVQSEHLKKHRRTHTGEKPHRCPRCWQGFADLHRLKSHQCSLTSA
ncbi:zinc finger and SCAN domain-containing protein 2-like isoform X1 [Acipenser ruthenus]|uniref:zinc finger and SCAN domain-containing protein 2-like isoform X1 n=1 Tax=Acipenser ruthenus TaxID=7906 RepID=UPI0027420409|nr:zinc finger and SCAN domain-containing protein 2-like isoform X1 [Acipenser ruthenus]